MPEAIEKRCIVHGTPYLIATVFIYSSKNKPVIRYPVRIHRFLELGLPVRIMMKAKIEVYLNFKLIFASYKVFGILLKRIKG